LLALTLRHVVGRGGTLLAEALTHPLVPPIAAECGVRVAPVPIDGEGLIAEAVERACIEQAPAALYCNPTGHNPTASVMPAERRAAIAAIARRHGIAIIEDDVLGALRRSGPPPIAHFGPDCVWYLQTLSKCVGLGFRIAYLVTPEPGHRDAIVGPMSMRSSWFPGALPVEIANHLMRTGLLGEINASFADASLRRQRIAETLMAGHRLVTCQGALHCWLHLPDGWTSDAFVAACRKAGVRIRPSAMFAAHPSAGAPGVPAVRIALAAPDTELQEGLRRLLTVLHARSEAA
jgi:DNA-binding transcriptional MocR family regulator